MTARPSGPSAAGSVGQDSLTWSPDEAHLAFALEHDSRWDTEGLPEVRAVVAVLHVASGSVRTVIPADSWTAHAPATAWSSEGDLLHTWSTRERSELRSLDIDTQQAEPDLVSDLGDTAAYRLDQTHLGLFAVGERGGSPGIYDLGDGTGEPKQVTHVPFGEYVRSVGGQGRWVLVQLSLGDEGHLVTQWSATGERVELHEVPGNTDTSAFAASGELAILTLLEDGSTALVVLDSDLQLVGQVTHAGTDSPAATDDLTWTERGVTVVNRYRDAPEEITIYSP